MVSKKVKVKVKLKKPLGFPKGFKIESDLKKKGYNILHGCPSWSKETDLSSVVRKHAWVRTPYHAIINIF